MATLEFQFFSKALKKVTTVNVILPEIHKTADGIGTVISINPLAGTIRVVLKDSPDTPPKQYHRSEVTPLGKAPKNTEKTEETAD